MNTWIARRLFLPDKKIFLQWIKSRIYYWYKDYTQAQKVFEVFKLKTLQ